jgi:diguanylate cyclase (GGDEF)-like protein
MDAMLTLEALQGLQQSNPAAALSAYRKQLRQAQESGDATLEATCLYGVADCAYDTGDFELASSHFTLAIVAFEQLGQRRELCDSLNSLGWARREEGQFQLALEAHQASLLLSQKHGWIDLEARAYSGFSVVYGDLGNAAQAHKFGLDSLRLLELTGDQLAIAHRKAALSVQYIRNQQFDYALELLESVLPFARGHDDKRLLIKTLLNLGAVMLNQVYGQDAGAGLGTGVGTGVGADINAPDLKAAQQMQAYYSEALELCIAQSDTQGETMCLIELGNVQFVFGHHRAALEYLELAQIQISNVTSETTIHLRTVTGHVFGSLGQYPEAVFELETAWAQAQELGLKHTERQVLDSLAKVYEAAGEHEKTVRALKALRVLERVAFDQEVQTRLQNLHVEYETDRLKHEASLERDRRNELEASNRQLEKLSLEDSLTGAHNRRYLEAFLGHEIARVARQKCDLSLVMLDLDHFKRINDSFSHAVGDRVLVALTQILRASSRKSDVIARIGGEEFVVVMPDTMFAQAQVACERLRVAIERYDWQALHQGLTVTASFGLVQAGADCSADALLALADAKLYEAKRNGRNCVQT